MMTTQLAAVVAVAFFLGGSTAWGQSSFAEAARSAREDLQGALQRLAEQRRAIAEEKIPLAKEFNEVTAEVRQQRRVAEMAARARDSRIYDLNVLEREGRLRRDEQQYIQNLLADYAQQLEGNLDLAELPRFQPAIDAVAEARDASPVEIVERQLGLVEQGLARLESLLGGEVIEGKAVMDKGRVLEGRFALFGPVALFASADGKVAGLARTEQSLTPKLYPFKGEAEEDAAAVVAGREAAVPIDVTLGTALALKESRDSLLEHIRKGGFWVFPILALAFVSLGLAVWKWRQLQPIKQPPPGLIHEILTCIQDGRIDEAVAIAERVRHPVGPLLVEAVKHADEPRELIEEVIYESWLAAQPPLQKGLSFISVTAATAPLLGLLGTVTGMITTFGLINIFGTGDAKNLSGGISEALITTELGLAVAIPALLLHAFLSRKVQAIIATMEKFGVAFLNGLPKARVA